MAECTCNVIASFPFLGGYGIISANLRSNSQVIITSEKTVLVGPSIGELSVTAYDEMAKFSCPGRAGVNYEWIQKHDCLNDIVYFVPRGGDRAYIEGAVNNITMTKILATESTGFAASAGSGPHTVYLSSSHVDGYDFGYNGKPFGVSGRDTSIGVFSHLIPDAELYLTSFTWEQSPPNIPNVSYSFIFAGKAG